MKPVAKRLFAVLLSADVLLSLCLTLPGCGASETPPSAGSSAESDDPDAVVSTARVLSTGDILIHSPLLNSYYDGANGTFDFTDIFQYVKPYVQRADLAVANLEVSLGGEEAGEYSGYPCFNCPDAIADALIDSGFDLLLTANNHVGDTGIDGFNRTQQVLTEKQIDWTGTRARAGDKPYKIEDINGIRVGILNATYITRVNGVTHLNGEPISDEFAARINCFDYNDLEPFYDEMRRAMSDMKDEGVQATIIYVHWGEEYHLSPMDYQKEMAQELCEIGFDAIIGGHPHVIEPTAVLTSESTGKKTFCLYSMGNEISNQRHELMANDISTSHTEDGLMISTEFTKKGDGTVTLSAVDIIPTWVHMYYNENGRRSYEIVPLDKSADWTEFNLSESSGLNEAEASYDRTMELVGRGLDEFRSLQPAGRAVPFSPKSAGTYRILKPAA